MGRVFSGNVVAMAKVKALGSVAALAGIVSITMAVSFDVHYGAMFGVVALGWVAWFTLSLVSITAGIALMRSKA